MYASGLRVNVRGSNALLKKRAATGVERTGTIDNALFKPGQILDELASAAGPVSIAFSFPETWALSKGPNLDVRDVRTSDSALLIVAPLPAFAKSLRELPDTFYTEAMFAPDGKYGAYGSVDDVRFVGEETLALSDSRGGRQSYRRLSLRFSPLTYNQNTVERRALLSATEVGGIVYILVAGCLATRYKKAQADLLGVQESFRAIGLRAAPRQGE